MLRLGISVASLSSIMNNTPIVAMMVPYVYQWGKKNKVSPSKLLIPLSYATILGGMITVLGTSTNLVLAGFILEENMEPLGFLDFLVPGIMVSVAGVSFIVLFFNKLLPNNRDLVGEATENFKEYLVETRVEKGAGIIRKSVQSAGLRNLDGIFLVEIIRGQETISPVDPEEKIEEGDRLFFAGEPNKVVELVRNNSGLSIPAHSGLKVGNGMNIVESVIPANSSLVGQTLKSIEFREKFDAAVIAIHRNGEKLRGKIGEIILDKGDLLLLSAGKTFLTTNKAGKDLYLVSELKKIQETPLLRKRLFWLISLTVILGSFFGLYPLFTTLLLLLGNAILFKFTNFDHIKKNVSLDLLIILGSAMALSNALIDSGAAHWLNGHLSFFSASFGPVGFIILIYTLTVVLTQFITNAAAIAIVFPIGLAMALEVGMNPHAAFLAMAFGASCSFMTPVAYQTNLMVYGPGNYRFSDFVRFGLPLSLIYSGIILSWIIFKYT